MRYLIIAGEASGDLHGANLIRGIIKADSDAEVYCRGGDLMERAGGVLLTHYRSTAFMGFTEVVLNLRTISRSMKECRQQIASLMPDAVILIDYPGFNLRMAAYAHKLGIPVFYYIAPKVWAWKESRIEKLKSYVTRLYSILPFEIEYFGRHKLPVHYFGNPLVDEIDRQRAHLCNRGAIYESLGLADKPVIALLPGSRLQEVKRILPAMLSVTGYYPDYQFVVAASSGIPEELYRSMPEYPEIKVVYGKTYELLAVAEAALVKSGTSTLEAAIIGTPQIVCYRAGAISYWLARMLVKVRFISLVNLLMDKEVVKELIQNDLKPVRIVREMNSLIRGGWKRDIIRKHYAEIRMMLGEPGVSERIATDMVRSLRETVDERV